MGKKKTPQYKPRTYESTGGKNGKKDTFAMIYTSMLYHPAYQSLTHRQKALYTYLKAQLIGHRKPKDDYPDLAAVRGDECFYFTMADATETGIYTKTMRTDFRKDMEELEKCGFIDCLLRGGSTRQKNIYALSNKWHTQIGEN